MGRDATGDDILLKNQTNNICPWFRSPVAVNGREEDIIKQAGRRVEAARFRKIASDDKETFVGIAQKPGKQNQQGLPLLPSRKQKNASRRKREIVLCRSTRPRLPTRSCDAPVAEGAGDASSPASSRPPNGVAGFSRDEGVSSTFCDEGVAATHSVNRMVPARRAT